MVDAPTAYHSSTTHVGQLQTGVQTAREALFNGSLWKSVRIELTEQCCLQRVPRWYNETHTQTCDQKVKRQLLRPEEDRAERSSG